MRNFRLGVIGLLAGWGICWVVGSLDVDAQAADAAPAASSEQAAPHVPPLQDVQDLAGMLAVLERDSDALQSLPPGSQIEFQLDIGNVRYISPGSDLLTPELSGIRALDATIMNMPDFACCGAIERLNAEIRRLNEAIIYKDTYIAELEKALQECGK